MQAGFSFFYTNLFVFSGDELMSKMREKWNIILYLIWFSYLIISATVMFGNGFLLSRKTLSDVSECRPLSDFSCDGKIISNSTEDYACSENEKIRNILANGDVPMACGPRKNRVLFVLVDALRYDFTEYDPNLESPFHYQNKLPVIAQTLEKHPDKSRLYRFMADPPTTTFQRIKALVTGSLPTFIDASSNFAAMELQEDSFIHQVERNGGLMVLLGDDTWARIMPGKFKRSHALYSFHTWDLDTVDLEVDSKIYDELLKDDWDLLIAHYLGVDHAGHRYGPHHPEMARKLNETNSRLEKIINTLPPDVLLYVVGDHGMTETGDHGGESKAERTAAFFAYRGSGFAGTNDIGKEVQQTDLAATISATMGRPPPAPSLGNLLLTVLPDMTFEETLLFLNNNLQQIAKYLIRYGEESHQIPLERLAELLNGTKEQIARANTIKTPEELQQYIADVRSTIDNMRLVFREVWVEFDSLSMLRALLLLLLAIFFNWLMTEGLPVDRIPGIFASSFVPTGYICMGVCVGICYMLMYLKVIDDVEHAIYLSTGLISGAVQCTLVIMHWDGISQRWYEGRSQFYERFARAALIASAAALVSNSFIIEEGVSLSFLALSVLGLMAWNIASMKALALWVCCGTVLAVSRLYRGCREEQGDCWTAGTAGPHNDTRASLVIALGAVAAVASISRRHVGWAGYGVAVASLLVCSHWAVGWGTLGSPSRSRLLARGAWLVICTMFLIIWKKNREGALLPLIICALLLFLANSLVLGVSYAPAAALALLSGFLALNIVSLLKNNNGSNKFAISKRCNSSVACAWALLASYQFYGSGHHATLGHVRWAPAFHAGDPTYLQFGNIITVMLVSLDLFGMLLMYGVTVPLLALWGKNSATTLGPRSQLVAVFSLSLKFALCFAIRVLAICISATIHCRHLMIWGVFTPKLLFEGASSASALVGMVLGAALTVWHLPTQQRSS